jgi:HSP20 family protein
MSFLRSESATSVDDPFNRLLSPAARVVRPKNKPGARSDWSPSVDISETASEYLIRAELPAVKAEDLQLIYEAGMLTLSGERRYKFEESSEKLHRIETCYGRFSRSFALPGSVNGTAIKAESKDGIVTIHVPKAKSEPNKPIEVDVELQEKATSAP